MSLLAATILTAWATVVLAVGAIITARLAWLAFQKQTAEVRAVEEQVGDQKELTSKQADLLKVQTDQLELQQRQFDQQEKDRRQDQASRVYIWTETGTDERFNQVQLALNPYHHEVVTAHVVNTSQQPVHDLHVSWRKGTTQWDQPERLAVLLSGKSHDFTHRLPDPLPPEPDWPLYSAVIIFRDRAQRWWRVRPDGMFEELPPGAEPPHSW